MDGSDAYVHAPTVTCSLLRAAADVIDTASQMLPGETIFFPLKEEGEGQPVQLKGDIPLDEISDLIRYLADMLEA